MSSRGETEPSEDHRLATPCDSQGGEAAEISGTTGVEPLPIPLGLRNGQQADQPTSATERHRWPNEFEEVGRDGRLLQAFPTPEETSHPDDLDLLRLNAPITAVHAMKPNCPSVGLSTPQSQGVHSQSQGTTSPAFQIGIDESGSNSADFDDVISAGLISEPKARELFHLYMAGANVFLPLFDTTTDTFEAVRERSSFCLCAILTVALQLDNTLPDSETILKKCSMEAQALASRTLFSSSAKAEDIQGMLVLAAYAEKNWFAVSHALEMAEDMGLHRCLSQLLRPSCPNNRQHPVPSNQKTLTRMARVSLVLHNVEREVASGSARPSRLTPLDEQLLRSFLECKHSVIYDIRIISTIEITQLRGRLLHEIEELQTIAGVVDGKLRRFQEEIDRWFTHWDEAYQENEINVASFHRASLRLQRDYALIILTSAMISKLGREPHLRRSQFEMGEEMSRIIDITMETSIHLLNFMSQSDSYKWHLRWAPTYSALFAVFAAALVFKLSVLRPPMSNWSNLLSALTIIADVLDLRYPKYGQILRELCQSAPFRSPSNSPNGMWANRVHATSDTSTSAGGALSHSVAMDSQSPRAMLADTLPSYLQHPLQEGLPGSEAHEAQFAHSRPDFMLDYNSFAASLAAYESGCADVFDYTSLNSHPGEHNP